MSSPISDCWTDCPSSHGGPTPGRPKGLAGPAPCQNVSSKEEQILLDVVLLATDVDVHPRREELEDTAVLLGEGEGSGGEQTTGQPRGRGSSNEGHSLQACRVQVRCLCMPR